MRWNLRTFLCGRRVVSGVKKSNAHWSIECKFSEIELGVSENSTHLLSLLAFKPKNILELQRPIIGGLSGYNCLDFAVRYLPKVFFERLNHCLEVCQQRTASYSVGSRIFGGVQLLLHLQQRVEKSIIMNLLNG